MDEVKPLLASKTFWGAIIGVLAAGAGLFHYTITPADQASIIDLIVGVSGIAGSLIAIYGRIVASKQIGSVK